MATYEYKCSAEHLYTEVRAMSEEQKVTKCPTCGEPLSRIYSTAAAIFKGRGFYSTGG
jgi:putative FmdB family regulatory protein